MHYVRYLPFLQDFVENSLLAFSLIAYFKSLLKKDLSYPASGLSPRVWGALLLKILGGLGWVFILFIISQIWLYFHILTFAQNKSFTDWK